MPRALSWRIGLAFAVLAVATWIAIGATLFFVLRGLHADATVATLNNVAAPLAAQARQRLTVAADVRAVLADLRDQLDAGGYGLQIITADGHTLVVDGDTLPSDIVRIPPAAGRGATFNGTYRDGAEGFAWVAVVLRNPSAAGPRALVLTTPDRSAGDAFRDLIAALPAVVLVSLLVGAPIAWLLARSVAQPLRRLSRAAADLPAGNVPATATATATAPSPLPLEGPTEVRDLTHRFNAMAAELGRTRREEAEMLANLRHDLRTPVTVIGGFAAALTDGTASGDDIGRAARAIEEEAARLEELVGQLGAAERVASGGASLRPETIDVADLLSRTAERFGAGAAAQDIDIVPLAVAPGLTLTADRLAVERVVGNLVSNAIAAVTTSTAPGEARSVGRGGAPARGHIWLSARAASGTPAGDAVAIEVTDDGPGFPPGTIDRVFERFYRGDASRTRSGGGAGLGLSIVRDLARAHGGEAFAENVAPHGARVGVVLPQVPVIQR